MQNPFHLTITRTGEFDHEEFLSDVTEAADGYFDSADIDGRGVITIDGTVPYAVILSLLMTKVRLLDWQNIRIAGGMVE